MIESNVVHSSDVDELKNISTNEISNDVIDKERLTILKRFQKKIGVEFKDISLLNLALTHSSYAREFEPRLQDNERLEFLGDAVLELAASTYLYDYFKDYSEGELSKTRASIVCQASLSTIAKKLRLGKYLLLSHGEEANGGRDKVSTLEDAFEAVIGAIYLDQGWFTAFDFVYRYLVPISDKMIHANQTANYKSELQEYIQGTTGKCDIEYIQISAEGPDHMRSFECAVKIEGKIFGKGKGTSKKAAEQKAAKAALRKIQRSND